MNNRGQDSIRAIDIVLRARPLLRKTPTQSALFDLLPPVYCLLSTV